MSNKDVKIVSQVKWIKLTTDMFDDEKIKLIENMPESDTILIIWIKLLAQAGKTNASGYIYLNENIPYTDEMLATIFNRPLSTVRLALQTLKQMNMIYIDEDNHIQIVNWEKHQNIEGLERIREQTRKRVAKHRNNQKALENKGNVTVTLRNATDIDKELDIDIDKDKKEIPYKSIIDYLNEKADKRFRHTTAKNKEFIRSRWNEGNTLDDFKRVIDIKVSQWKNDKDMNQYLRPQTLFGTKFESYLNEKPINKPLTPQAPKEWSGEY